MTAGVLKIKDKKLPSFLKSGNIEPKPLLICSGGTSSRCAADGHWTLDLRHYNHLDFNEEDKSICIGAGITMGQLQKELSKNYRSFPIGLSGSTGLGYILTGGISPLSRSQGLAIDNILEIKGVWGNGKRFSISDPSRSSSKEERKKWRGLCGAAPFLGVISEVKLKTYPNRRLKLLQASVNPKSLSNIIILAEQWPPGSSLQWIWEDQIIIYATFIEDDEHSLTVLKELITNEQIYLNNKRISSIPGQAFLPVFSSTLNNNKNSTRVHSEVIGLLGTEWGPDNQRVINCLEKLICERPFHKCSIASQQLGCETKKVEINKTSFIHRSAVWKPWITASWPANDQDTRKLSIKWLLQVWEALQDVCPGIHLAQLHQHQNWHNKEVKLAFDEWLPELQALKAECDPSNLLPQLFI